MIKSAGRVSNNARSKYLTIKGLRGAKISGKTKPNKFFLWFKRRFLDEKVDGVPKTLVDLGCGNGSFLLSVLSAFPTWNLIGIDGSKEVAESFPVDTPISFIYSDVNHYLDSVERESLDFISAIDLFEHLTLDEFYLALASCMRSLKMGGKLIFRIPNAGGIFGISTFYGDITHKLFLNGSSMEQVLRLANIDSYEILESDPLPYGLFGVARSLFWKACIRPAVSFVKFVESGYFDRRPLISRNLIVVIVKS